MDFSKTVRGPLVKTCVTIQTSTERELVFSVQSTDKGANVLSQISQQYVHCPVLRRTRLHAVFIQYASSSLQTRSFSRVNAHVNFQVAQTRKDLITNFTSQPYEVATSKCHWNLLSQNVTCCICYN